VLGKFLEGSESGRTNLFSAERNYRLKKDVEKVRSYNLFAHQLVPKHELLSKKDADELMHTFHIRPHQLPYIKTSDPGAEALGAKMGDILRITRKSATAGEVVVYRYVVD
jgi:DNA-directed RNA polymerase subunit H